MIQLKNNQKSRRTIENIQIQKQKQLYLGNYILVNTKRSINSSRNIIAFSLVSIIINILQAIKSNFIYFIQYYYLEYSYLSSKLLLILRITLNFIILNIYYYQLFSFLELGGGYSLLQSYYINYFINIKELIQLVYRIYSRMISSIRSRRSFID